LIASIIIGTAAVVIGALHHQSIWPTAQWYGRTFRGLPRGTRRLALTYDDGPNDPYSLHLLDVLSKHDVRATFFLIGRYVEKRPDIVREMVKRGHSVGNHTFTHPLLTLQPEEEIRNQLSDCNKAIFQATGEQPQLFRPPFGGRRPVVLRASRSLGLEPIMWTIVAYDWNAPPASVIQRRIASRIRGGDVILLHDGGHKKMGADRSQTVQATDQLLKCCLQEEYEFVTIPEMMREANAAVPHPAAGRI
jgi:peptidoglycan/xylan/chitin deacetylase (PgdA/CDA1 family)